MTELGVEWLGLHQASVKPSTYKSDESAWRVHVEPKWGGWKIGDITRAEIRTWMAGDLKGMSRTSVARCVGVLAAVLDHAVEARKLATNVARGVKLPSANPKKRAYLTRDEVRLLASCAKYPGLIEFMAVTGLRRGEISGLRVSHIDPARRRILVEENAAEVNGKFVVGSTKTAAGRRSVPYPAHLDPVVQSACAGKQPDQLAWGNGTTHLRFGNMQSGWFIGAVKRAQQKTERARAQAEAAGETPPRAFPRLSPHDLRHTAVSLAVSAGVPVQVVSKIAGHSSVKTTLDIYTDLYDQDIDTAGETMNAAYERWAATA